MSADRGDDRDARQSVDMSAALNRLVDAYVALRPASVAQLGTCYAPDARFRDPFNDVTGVPAIERVFAHMFTQVESPRFEVSARFLSGDQAMLLWTLHFRSARLGPGEHAIRGASHLRFDGAGRVVWHEDHWDPAAQLYGRLPLVGPLLRWLARRFAAGG